MPRDESGAEERQCNCCGRTYANMVALRRHMARKHSARNDELSAESLLSYFGFCCDVCGRGYEKQPEMLAHRRVYHEGAQEMRWLVFRSSAGKLKQCANCAMRFRSGRYFEEHSCPDAEQIAALEERLQQVLRLKPTFRCNICSMCFGWKLTLRQHREATHPAAAPLDWVTMKAVEVRHYCNVCFVAFDEPKKMAQHRCANTETKLKAYVCDLCGLCYRQEADYRRHRRLSHAIPEPDAAPAVKVERRKPATQCPYCDYSAVLRNDVLAHMKEAHDVEVDSPYVCVVCDKVFKHKLNLEMHNQTYHPQDESTADNERILRSAQITVNGAPAYRCQLCSRNWFDQVRFLAHHRLHAVERKFTCDQCGKQMRFQHHLNQHIKTTHLDIRNHSCDICEKSFHTKQACDQHRRIHTGERPFPCETCGKSFVAPNALISHKRIHSDFYPHACHLCPKKFKVRRSLTHHIRRHTGERPYLCEICSKTFNNSSLFSYHLRVTHSDNRPFKCEQCGSRFKANRFLTRHKKLHETRTHVQIKRRNNPEYFAAQKAAKKGARVEESPEKVDSGEDDTVSIATTMLDRLEPQVDLEVVESGTS